MTVLVVDNYDSFAYNLVDYVASEHDADVVVRRNDAVDLNDVRALDPEAIVVSPGPGTPAEAGVSVSLFDTDYPILGVCLGHQALCAARGADVVRADAVVHGKPSAIRHDGDGIFDGLPDAVTVGRYHSLAVDADTLPARLVETAWTADGEDDDVVMAVRDREKPHVGVQFHPESVLTGRSDDPADLSLGRRLVANFLAGATRDRDRGRNRQQ
ncbi:anthranilate synthase component 2 [Halarchaeum rubridurum]|uniref:anthranilate synthase n=1 Tax=Halarchaeum rubridurum TaxID=489911 RepID=A0A830FUL4_9EURY|nr:aminodeoxychorismate/anthranilate synthase component II [Halarchaeum rubridurum]MBP1954523.1 anthranilate synthase component 2 [Halarchaeum rubridurum]GGM61802.1 glutamine amidotransferase [Halarchaeum rubridurum]